MKDYNGFSGAQRNKAQAWLNRQWGAGVFDRPDECCACHQTNGLIDAHAEDYSEPFTYAKLMRFPLCYVCHMMVHTRERNPVRWDTYRDLVGRGWTPPAYETRNFPRFIVQFMSPAGMPQEGWRQYEPRNRRPLDVIHVWRDRRLGPQ